MCLSLLSLFGSVELFHKAFSLFPFLKVWSTSTCEFVRTLNGHKRGIACLQYRDRLVVSGSSDNTIRYDLLKVNPLLFLLKKKYIYFLHVKLLCNFSPKKFQSGLFLFVFADSRPSVRLQVMGYRVRGVLASAGRPRGACALHSLRQQKNCQRRLRWVSATPSLWVLCVVVLSGF